MIKELITINVAGNFISIEKEGEKERERERERWETNRTMEVSLESYGSSWIKKIERGGEKDTSVYVPT